MSNILGKIIIFYTYINVMIFNLFKSKPTLRELIPEGFVDIHSHILPGIDDGAKNIEESLLLISKMKELGFSKIIATPHTYPGIYENTNESILKSYKNVNDNISNDVYISFASEYLIDSTLIKKAEKKSLLCLKDNLVLLETSFMGATNDLFDIIFELRLNNYIPVIAHPERYLYASNDLGFFYKLKKNNCLFQINLLSCIAHYGYEVVSLTDKLLKRGWIDYVGSDIHSTKHIDKFENKVECKEIEKLENAIANNINF